jgi:hypothetical protein
MKWPPAWALVNCNRGSRKGAAVQRGLQHGSIGIAIVRSRYKEKPSEYTAGFARALAIRKVWKSAIML